MKLRKNEMTSPKNFLFPTWVFQNSYRGISNFLKSNLERVSNCDAVSSGLDTYLRQEDYDCILTWHDRYAHTD